MFDRNVRKERGSLPSGAVYVVEVPPQWNGVLLLVSHPVPVAPGHPPWEHDEPLINHLVSCGYAVAGSANTIFWPLEQVEADRGPLIDTATRIVGSPSHTIAVGLSIGGIISAASVQDFPELLSGCLALCGNLAGAVANHNRELDITFVVKTLLAPDSPLRVVGIRNSQDNLALATRILHQAQATAEGRARLALAAAVGNVPGWHDPLTAEPDVSDVAARQRNQFAWFEQVGFLVYFLARRQVEMQAGGNPSWNIGVDYGALLSASVNRGVVEALYGSAQVDLDEDLDCLAAAGRIEADPSAVEYLERHIVFNGHLGGVPVLAMHTDGDGLVIPDHEHAYADVVHHAGNQDLLRQLYVHRGGHCTFTFAEMRTALDALVARIETGAWPDLRPGALNELAGRLGTRANVLASGIPAEPHFFRFHPPAFPRPYDSRHVTARHQAAIGVGRDRPAVPSGTTSGGR